MAQLSREQVIARIAEVRAGAAGGLREADLSFIDLSRVDLQGIDLTSARLQGADLRAADLRGACIMEANLASCRLAGADLTSSDLTRAVLTRVSLFEKGFGTAILAQATLTGAKVWGSHLHQVYRQEVDIRGVVWEEEPYAAWKKEYYRACHHHDARVTSVNLSGLDLGWRESWSVEGGSKFIVAYFRGADLTGADFSGTNLCRANFASANLTNARLTRANLTQAYLRGAILAGCNLAHANLQDADLEGAFLRGADLTGANLLGTRIAGADLREVKLEGVELGTATIVPVEFTDRKREQAVLTTALKAGYILTDARARAANLDLSGTDLSGYDLRGVDLSGVDFSSAKLTRALLRGASLNEAKFTGADLSSFTVALAETASRFLTSWQTSNMLHADGQAADIRHCQQSEREVFCYLQL